MDITGSATIEDTVTEVTFDDDVMVVTMLNGTRLVFGENEIKKIALAIEEKNIESQIEDE